MNRVILVGYLGRDVRYTQFESGKELSTLRLATRTGYGDKAYVEWHNIECWDRLARQCRDYLSKGDKVLIEGTIKTYTWEEESQEFGTIVKTDKRILAKDVEFMHLKGKSKKKVEDSDPEWGGQD